MCIYIYIYICRCIYIYIYIHTCMYIYIYMCIHTSINKYIHIYIYIYIYLPLVLMITAALRIILNTATILIHAHIHSMCARCVHTCSMCDRAYTAHTVDFRNFIVSFGPRPWHIEIRHRVKKTSTINLFGFETLKLKIRRLKLWKPTVIYSWDT